MFSVTGEYKGRTVDLTWDDGKLDGDPGAVARIEGKAVELDGVDVGTPTGPFTTTNHLSDALSALFIIDEVLDDIADVTGDVPEAPGEPAPSCRVALLFPTWRE